MYNNVRSIRMTALLLLIIGAALIHADSPVFNNYLKCKTTLTSQRIMELCYKEVTGKEADPATMTLADVSEKEKEDTMYCALKKNGVIGLDGKTVNNRKADNLIDSLEAEQDIKNKLKEASKACADKGGEGIDYVRCNMELIAKVCKA